MTELILDGDFFLSSELREIEISTSQDYVEASILYNSESIWGADLAVSDGYACLFDVRKIIEQFMIDRGLIRASFRIMANSAFKDISVQYCSLVFKKKSFFIDSFLSCLKARFVDSMSEISLSAPANEDDLILELVISYKGLRFTREIILANRFDDCKSIVMSIEDIIGRYCAEGEKLMCIKAKNGKRSMLFYVCTDSIAIRMYYRNAFNAIEIIDFPASVKEILSVGRSEGVVMGEAVNYDVNTAKSYEVEPRLLSKAEYYCLEQAMMSDFVCVKSEYGSGRIIITESEMERTSDSIEPCCPKFSFRFVENTPHANLDLIDSLESKINRAYSSEFSNEFA